MEPEEQQPQQPERVNPFRELPKPTQPQQKAAVAKDKPHHKPSKEITIKLRPWGVVKAIFLLFLLVGIFFAGRFTAGGEGMNLPDFSKYFSSDSGPSGLVTGDTDTAEEPEATTEAAPAEEEQAEDTQLAVDNETAEVAAEVEDVEDKPERFVDEKYEHITLNLDGVYKDWKGTWGKIIGVKYTITNLEAGTVKPHHFTMVVEGYEDGEKLFDVAYTTQRIKAGQTLSDEASVSGGFAYSPVTIPDGDLSKVRISLVLLDEDSDVMAATAQEVDLSE